MKRLTKVFDSICIGDETVADKTVAYVGDFKKYDADTSAELSSAAVCDVLKRLAAYEDSGYSPEELQTTLDKDVHGCVLKLIRWLQAEEEGRLLVLPKLVTIDGLKERLMRALEPKDDEAETYTSGYHNGYHGGYADALRLVLGITNYEEEIDLLYPPEEKQPCTEK